MTNIIGLCVSLIFCVQKTWSFHVTVLKMGNKSSKSTKKKNSLAKSSGNPEEESNSAVHLEVTGEGRTYYHYFIIIVILNHIWMDSQITLIIMIQ